jgi:hypothetical protein
MYLTYIGALIIAPYFVKPYGDSLDKVLPPLYRLILAVVLMVVFGGLLLHELIKGQKRGEGPQDTLPINRAAPLGRTPGQGSVEPRFAPVPGTNIPPPTPPQTVQRVREVERPASAPNIFTYPLVVEGGIYEDTYIQLTPSKIVRIRSLMVDQRYMS